MKLDKYKWTDYFRDTIHSTLDLGLLYLRWLPAERRGTLDKEYWAQKIISNINLAPSPYLKLHFPNELLPSLILEEKVNFHKIYKKTDQFIIDTAEALSRVHDYARKQKNLTNKHIPEDNLLTDGVYNPLVILKVFILEPLEKLKETKKHLVNRTVQTTINEITKKVKKLNSKINFTRDNCSLVHGDLNDTNIVRTKKGEIMIIDWADCRWDIVTCDLSQFIYLHFLTKREEKLFLKSYNSEWITEEMIEIHRILLIGWDLIYLMTVDLNFESDKADRLDPLKKKVWESNIIPL